MNSLEPGLRRHPAEVWKDLGEMGSCTAAGVCSQADLPFPFPVVWSMPLNAGAPELVVGGLPLVMGNPESSNNLSRVV